MNGLARFFLILLRFAIGWHFLFEGIDKVESIRRGPTETSRPFSSEPYLREVSGPLSPYIRQLTGDPDQAALLRLTPVTFGTDSKQEPKNGTGLPQDVHKDWEEYFNRFVAYYDIAKDPAQLEKAKEALLKAEDRAGQWLINGEKVIDRSFSRADFKDLMSTKDRVDLYRRKVPTDSRHAGPRVDGLPERRGKRPAGRVEGRSSPDA